MELDPFQNSLFQIQCLSESVCKGVKAIEKKLRVLRIHATQAVKPSNPHGRVYGGKEIYDMPVTGKDVETWAKPIRKATKAKIYIA